VIEFEAIWLFFFWVLVHIFHTAQVSCLHSLKNQDGFEQPTPSQIPEQKNMPSNQKQNFKAQALNVFLGADPLKQAPCQKQIGSSSFDRLNIGISRENKLEQILRSMSGDNNLSDDGCTDRSISDLSSLSDEGSRSASNHMVDALFMGRRGSNTSSTTNERNSFKEENFAGNKDLASTSRSSKGSRVTRNDTKEAFHFYQVYAGAASKLRASTRMGR
jgi:hypothetical protein